MGYRDVGDPLKKHSLSNDHGRVEIRNDRHDVIACIIFG